MGTDGPAVGGEQKPIIRNEVGDFMHPRRNNHNKRFMKKERFQGAHPDLSGFVFETGTNRTNQIANFTTVDTRI